MSPLEIKRLEKNIRIEHVWSSAAIEGNTLSENETAAIIDSGIGATIHGKTIKETLEILDLNQAYNYMEDLATQKQEITIADMRNLNQKLVLIGQLKYILMAQIKDPMHFHLKFQKRCNNYKIGVIKLE
ncbi:hypothetical protein OZX56_02985 [Lactobacillus sp. ESL0684]|uniref:hypothetical protein n=1 Tax=Lactobacillus sp. ESL0684 TaxID=2983213 RepID=UPI0023F822BD|nr:hypothetical protein [Lactobacillus sp. ESL0684]WEV44207.1 hypothetical protein OZX56_02985 [Lactobacillus sp. ESL0684]